MDRSMWLRVCATVALPLALGGITPVHAETADDDAFSLKLSKALRERSFMRAGAIYVSTKTTSGDAYDVTGPVVRRGDLVNAAPTSGLGGSIRSDMVTAGNALDFEMANLGLTGIGAPAGVRARADDSIATLGLSVGHWLSDEYTWLVEAYVMAAPLKSKIYGDGVNALGDPNGINGKHIMDTKLLPPTVLVGRYWGDRTAKFRPYTGVMAMYAIFYDSKIRQTLNNYMAGGSPGDSTVSLKNTFGFGPSIGFKYELDDSWHLSVNVGSVKLKTQATLTTHNTMITGSSPILNDYPLAIRNAIQTAQNMDSGVNSAFYLARGGAVATFMKGLATSRGAENLGTYVRKQDTTLTGTVMMLSVGRSF